MSITSLTSPARAGTLTARCRGWLAQIADRAHAAGDAQAGAASWTVTVTPGRFGLSGRAYRDSRFGSQAGTLLPREGQR